MCFSLLAIYYHLAGKIQGDRLIQHTIDIPVNNINKRAPITSAPLHYPANLSRIWHFTWSGSKELATSSRSVTTLFLAIAWNCVLHVS